MTKTRYPGLTAIDSGFTISARGWERQAYITGRFPQTLDLRAVKRLHTWLGKFIAANEQETEPSE